MDTDRALRIARVVERLGDAGRAQRLRRVEDAWLRGLSRRTLQAVSHELRSQRARRPDGDTAALP